jgi:hypothetical protein|mmetsp:Transcript_6458/g.10590  ORF Transcript_6458/g.10590 Transcript_6458/m.10590 type:complete len:326 (+) Transcript_6458:107-1084(+)
MQQYVQQLQKASDLYKEDKTLQAHAVVCDVEAQLKTAALSEEEKQALHTRLSEDATIREIRQEAERVAHLRQTLSSDDLWTVVSDRFGVRTLFREDEETHPFHLIRVEGYVEAPLLDLLAILCEIDLWPGWMVPQTWICGLREAKILAQPRPTHLLAYLAATMPWPVSHRDIAMNVKAVDCMDPHELYHRQIVVLLNSCSTFPGAEIPDPGDFVRADIKSSGILLTPEAPAPGTTTPRTFVQLVICADTKLPYAPVWVMNLFMKNLVFLFLPSLRSQVKTVPTSAIYQGRIGANPDLYDYLRRRMRECFPQGLPLEEQEEGLEDM